jgi:hypothetical protein
VLDKKTQLMVFLQQGTRMSGDSREDEELCTLPNANEVLDNALVSMLNLSQVDAIVYINRVYWANGIRCMN